MKSLRDVEAGTTVTVTKVTGGRSMQRELEKKCVMAGSDVTVLETKPDGSMKVDTLKGRMDLSAAEAACIGAGKQYVRTCEPILMGGCCSVGNTSELLERMEEVNGNVSKNSRF